MDFFYCLISLSFLAFVPEENKLLQKLLESGHDKRKLKETIILTKIYLFNITE